MRPEKLREILKEHPELGLVAIREGVKTIDKSIESEKKSGRNEIRECLLMAVGSLFLLKEEKEADWFFQSRLFIDLIDDLSIHSEGQSPVIKRLSAWIQEEEQCTTRMQATH